MTRLVETVRRVRPRPGILRFLPRFLRRAAGLCALALVCGGCGEGYVSPGMEDRAAAQKYLDEARGHATQGDMRAAIRMADAAVKAAPSSFMPYMVRAKMFAQMMRLREATRDLRTARRVSGGDVQVTLELLTILPPYNSSQEMEQLARHVLDLQPEHPRGHYYLGLALANSPDLARWPEAREPLRRMARAYPSEVPVRIELGKLEARLGNDRGAAEYLGQAWRLLDPARQAENPTGPPPEVRAQRQSAAFWLREVYRRRRDARLPGITRALDQMNRRAEQEAAQRERALAIPPDLEAKLAVARLALADRQPDTTLLYAKQVLAVRPEDPEARQLVEAAEKGIDESRGMLRAPEHRQ